MFVSKEKPLSYNRSFEITKAASFRTYISQKRNYLVTKKALDFVISVVVLLFILSWLLPIIAILIKLTSKGSVFFVQKRVGFLGRSFNCYKFRTMVKNEVADVQAATDNDPRITSIGKFLRNSNLDELPQFINVLKGDMSIVGPRPHMHADCTNFSEVVDNYKFRNILRPGITGMAQVKGYRGPAKTLDNIVKRYQWDAFYVRNANFWLDMRIIRKTAAQTILFAFKLVFSAKGSRRQKEEPRFFEKALLDMRQRMNGLL